MVSESSSNETQKPLRIAIIGAGIGGLSLAVALSRIIPEGSLKIDIYEQAHEIKEIGAGVVFWPRTWEILQRLGVDNALAEHLPKKKTTERTLVWKVKKSDHGQSLDLFEHYDDNGGPIPFHRAAVQKTLMSFLPATTEIHLSHRLVSYDETDDQVVLNFENHPSQTCDLLVAADGIKSHIRGEFLTKRFPEQKGSIDPVWSGSIAYRALINADKVRDMFPEHESLFTPILYAGDGNYGITYPIMQGRFINLAAMTTDNSKEGTQYEGLTVELSSKEDVQALFNGWSGEFLEMLKHIESCSKWTIQYLNPLQNFAFGRVALLGDAAHAMPPNLGSGAGQAVEDAYILAHILSKTLKTNIPIHRVTETYSKTREPVANLVLQRSKDMRRLISTRVRDYEGVDSETAKKISEEFALEFKGMFGWWETHPVEKELEKALEML